MKGDSINISVKMGSLILKNPFIVSSGPISRNLDQIKKAEENGWAAVSLKLSIDPFPYINLSPRYRWFEKEKLHIFTAEKRLSTDEALKLLEDAKKITDDILIFPNVIYSNNDITGWGKLAKQFENAGADAIELNMCCPNLSFNIESTTKRTDKPIGASIGLDLDMLSLIVREVVNSVKIPVIVKLTPEGCNISKAAEACVKSGATAVGGTANRLGLPDVDIWHPMDSVYRLQDQITLGCMSGPWIRPLALRDTYEMRLYLGKEPFIIGSGGIRDLRSAVQQIMAGADALWICTEIMLRGFGWLEELIEDLKKYMGEMGNTEIKDFRDLLHNIIVPANELVLHDGYAEVDPGICNACGLCWNIGHCDAITHLDGTTRIRAEKCLGCSTCVDLCPRGAISIIRK